MGAAFELVDVVKRYPGGVEALRGISLAVAPGEVLGLLGPNGAGKTTAIKCLVGLVRPTGGEARVGGIEARAPEARRSLGYVPERPDYPGHLSGRELLEREARLFGLARSARTKRVEELLAQVALDAAVASRRCGTLSKGERARLGLALALVNEPSVVLLDEPADGLDPVGRRAVRELLEGLRRDDRSVLLNSHLLGEVEASCDRIAILKAGRLLTQGTTAELLAKREATYRLRLAEPPDAALLAALAPRVDEHEVEGAALTIRLRAIDDLDALVDLLRERGARIRELRPQGGLEDVFLELVT